MHVKPFNKKINKFKSHAQQDLTPETLSEVSATGSKKLLKSCQGFFQTLCAPPTTPNQVLKYFSVT